MSTERFAPAEAAMKAGDFEAGARMIEAELERDPKAPVGVYRNFSAMLFRRGEHARAGRWAKAGVALYPKDFELWNLLGVAYRRQKDHENAIKALRQAEKLNPKNTAATSNLGNVYNDLRNPAAIDIFSKLVRQQPSAHEWQRSLGRAYWFAGDLTKALMRLNLAVKLRSDYVDGWLDLAAVTAEQNGYVASLAVMDQAMAAVPDQVRLYEARSTALRRTGRLRDAEAYLISLRDRYDDQAWLHYHLGGVICDYDRERGNAHFEKAIALAPDNFDQRVALIESLARSRYGDEAAHFERAYVLLKESLTPETELSPSSLKVALEVLIRMADYELAGSLGGGFSEVGHSWADNGKHTALMGHLSRVKTPEDRYDILEMHRGWGRAVIKATERWPITQRSPRPDNGKIRVGFMSSDLRHHPVAYFAMPLFQYIDRSKFEVYCYSFYQGKEDALQKEITANVDAFRWHQDISDHDAAQMIADDQLDILLELGGSTHMNKLGVMAYKPAPICASWLGYPHSAGLETIDYIVVDPYLTPPDPRLLIEKPLQMPHTWLALGHQIFSDRHVIEEGLPEDRNGYITFGTANNPHKYSEAMLRAWARVVRDAPNSRFEFIRPEGGSPSFRSNIEAIFAKEGVEADRLFFRVIRGSHMQFYNEVDITLDPFPLTGGTSTCEALWMGVPVVNLRGQALFERLSGSILTNVGLADHVAETPEQYHEIALKLAADQARRRDLRANLRQRLKDSPLGQTEAFARDFYAMIEGAVRAGSTRKEALLEQAGT